MYQITFFGTIFVKRYIYQQIINWKNSSSRKPLLLHGARQVGKTYLMLEFAKANYKNYVYINFEEDPSLGELFSKSIAPDVLIEQLSFYTNQKIEPHETLIIFDEIQLVDRAITSLKYFYEKANDYHVMAAGSLLGVSIGRQSSFPVGKVDFLDLYPLNFIEYLQAIDETMLANLLLEKNDFTAIATPLHEKLTRLFRTFLYVGGMPEVVEHFRVNRDVVAVQRIQEAILKAYANDFSKYADPSESLKISNVWQSIPAQLSKELKKFQFKLLDTNARYSRYELAIEWLRKAGLIYLTHNIKTAQLPLDGYIEPNIFKLYYLDTGLLASRLGLSSQLITHGDELYTDFKGAMIENYVAKEIKPVLGEHLYYWSSNNKAEVDFVVALNNQIVPIEVKSGLSRHKQSLRSFQEKYASQIILRFSPRNFTREGDFANIPLYASCVFKMPLASL